MGIACSSFFYLYHEYSCMKKLILILFLFSGLILRGQYNYTDNCKQAHELITALKFNEASSYITAERNQNPDNLIPVILDNYIDFLSILVSEDEAVFDSLIEFRAERMTLLSEGDMDSPWYRSLLAKMNLQWAFARIKFASYFTAGIEIRRAYLLLAENKELYPEFYHDKVGFGIMHALIGTIPDNFKWVARLFSMDGSVEQGRNELKEVLENADALGYGYLKGEALFFLSFIDLNLQADRDRAIELLPFYDSTAKDNLMLTFSLSRILMQNAHNDSAIQLLVNHPHGKEYYPFYYLDYLSGLTKLNRLDDDAGIYFLKFTTNFKGQSYMKSAYQRLAWINLLKGDTLKYKELMLKVEKYGDDFTDGDKLALSEAISGFIPNIELLKARLLFDGGYYYKADSILNICEGSFDRIKDKLEYPYRRGRISHAQGNLATALDWYDKCVLEGKGSPWYFAANAALQSGMIHEEQGRLELAEMYYEKCLDMDNLEYRTSIAQKAKAGLNRIGEISESVK